MKKIFKIGIKITANRVDPNSHPQKLESVVITADAETISGVASVINNRDLNPKVVDYNYDGPTVIVLTPQTGYEFNWKLITGVAYLATLFAQANDITEILEIVEEKADWLEVPVLERFVINIQTVSELKKIWLGAKMVARLRQIAHDLQYEGLYSGDVSNWLYEGTQASRRLKFSGHPVTGLNDVDRYLYIIQKTLDTITDKNKDKINLRKALLRDIEAFSSLFEEDNTLSITEITKRYISTEKNLYAEKARLAKEVQDFDTQFNKAHEAIKEIRANTPPEPPAPIIKK